MANAIREREEDLNKSIHWVRVDYSVDPGDYDFFAARTADGIPEPCEAIIWDASRGVYQAGLLRGSQMWSGSNLQGTAGKYGARYKASRMALIARINERLPATWRVSSALTRLRGESRWIRRLVVRQVSTDELADVYYIWGIRA